MSSWVGNPGRPLYVIPCGSAGLKKELVQYMHVLGCNDTSRRTIWAGNPSRCDTSWVSSGNEKNVFVCEDLHQQISQSFYALPVCYLFFLGFFSFPGIPWILFNGLQLGKSCHLCPGFIRQWNHETDPWIVCLHMQSKVPSKRESRYTFNLFNNFEFYLGQILSKYQSEPKSVQEIL